MKFIIRLGEAKPIDAIKLSIPENKKASAKFVNTPLNETAINPFYDF